MPLAQLFLILYGLFALATPVMVIALYLRYSKLHARVKAAEDESARQASALRQELAKLSRELAALRAASENAAIDRAQSHTATGESPTEKDASKERKLNERSARRRQQRRPQVRRRNF